MAKYNGARALFGYCNGHGVLLERILQVPEPLTLGYAMTQAQYDALSSYEPYFEYAIGEQASGESIKTITSIQKQEYDALTVKDPYTLYKIFGGADVRFRDDPIDKIYKNGIVIWERSPYPNWFPETPEPSPSIWYTAFPYYAIFGIYRWGTTPFLFRYASPTNRAVSFSTNSNNQLISSGFGGSGDEKFERAHIQNGVWIATDGYWVANRTENNCNNVFLYDTNFTNITLTGIPKE